MGYKVVTGGTDNHLFLLDLTDTGLTGREVQEELDRCGITLNKNCVPGGQTLAVPDQRRPHRHRRHDHQGLYGGVISAALPTVSTRWCGR